MPTEPTTDHTAPPQRPERLEVAAPPEDWRAAVTGPRHYDAGSPAPRRDRNRQPEPDPGEGDRSWPQRATDAERRVAQLEEALVSRAGIEQAKGVLMATFGLAADDAFAVLVRASQHSNTRLVVIADQLVRRIGDTGLGRPAAGQVRNLLDELAATRPTPGPLPHEPTGG